MKSTDKLTDIVARNSKPKDKPYRISDGESMFLEVMPNGSKYWRLAYRFAGKQKLLAIGIYPKMSIKDARKRRREAKEMIAAGSDPTAQKKIEKNLLSAESENSFESVSRKWLSIKKSSWEDDYHQKTTRLLERTLFPWLGNRAISQITPPELLAALRKTESTGKLETAARAKQIAGQIFRFAVGGGYAERDPSQDLKNQLATPKGKHFSAITEPKEVAKLLRAMDEFTGSIEVKSALLISPLLFQRPGEIRKMLWADLDFENAEWRYHVTKTDTLHIVPLSRQAIDILHTLRPVTGKSKFVFPSARGLSRSLSENAVRVALRSIGYSNDQMTPHGFRAMARTILDEVLGYRVDLIEHQLAHAVRDPNGRAYNRTAHLPARKEMMQAWSDYLYEIKKENYNVIPLRKASQLNTNQI